MDVEAAKSKSFVESKGEQTRGVVCSTFDFTSGILETLYQHPPRGGVWKPFTY